MQIFSENEVLGAWATQAVALNLGGVRVPVPGTRCKLAQEPQARVELEVEASSDFLRSSNWACGSTGPWAGTWYLALLYLKFIAPFPRSFCFKGDTNNSC
jgi:hypothetical protein